MGFHSRLPEQKYANLSRKTAKIGMDNIPDRNANTAIWPFASPTAPRTVISPAAKRPVPALAAGEHLVADAAYHRRPYFAGVLRARATSQPLATLRDMLTLPILFYCPPGPSSRQQGYHTPYGGILQVLSQRFWGKFFRTVLREESPLRRALRRTCRSGGHRAG